MYLVGLHIYYKMIRGPYNIKCAVQLIKCCSWWWTNDSPKHVEPFNEKIKIIRKNLCISLVYIHTVHTVLWYYIMYLCKHQKQPDIDQKAYINTWYNTMQPHVHLFLKMNIRLLETCRRRYNWIKSLMKKVSISLALLTCVHHDARFIQRKIHWRILSTAC